LYPRRIPYALCYDRTEETVYFSVLGQRSFFGSAGLRSVFSLPQHFGRKGRKLDGEGPPSRIFGAARVLRTVNPWLIGRNGESLPPGCQMKAYALVPALEGRVARMAKLADPPDLGFRNRRFHNVPLRFHRSPIYGRKTRFFNYQSRVDDRFDRAVWNRCVSCNCICD